MGKKDFRTITAEDLYLAHKNHVGYTEFLSRHGISGEELEKKIRVFFKKNAENMIRDFHRNDKKSRKEPVAPVSLAEPSSTGGNVIPLVRNYTPPETTESEEGELEKLRAREEKLAKKLRDFDAQRGALAIKHSRQCAEMQAVLDKIVGTRSLLNSQMQELEKLIQQDDENTIKPYNQLASEAAFYREERQETLARIRKLDAIKIYVTKNSITASNGKDFKPNEEGADRLFAMLTQGGLFDDLKVSDIRILARAWAINDNNMSNHAILFFFEDEELSAAFELLLNDRKSFEKEVVGTTLHMIK